MRNKLVTSFLLILLLSSCAITQDLLWGTKVDRDEIVKDLLINDDGEQVILVGKKYIYILSDDRKIVKKLYLWDGKQKLKFHNGIGTRGRSAVIDMYFEASVRDLSVEQVEFLESLEWRKFHHGQDISSPRLELKGLRSSAESGLVNIKNGKFISTGFIKTEHQEAIFEDPTPLQTTGKILLTPFALAADIILMPITIPYIIYRDHKLSHTDYYCQGDFCGYNKNSKKKNSSHQTQLKNGDQKQ